jgi:predicted Zn-dependent protease
MLSGLFTVHLLTYYAAPDMKKAFAQLTFLVMLFFSAWFLLSKVDFMKLLNVEHYSKSTEQKLGELIYESISETQTVETDSASLAKLDEIKVTICSKNSLDTAGIKIHLIKSKEVNAFALPNGHLVVYTGLIDDCESAEELSGVLGHEMAHIEHHHVMKKLVKEVGLSALMVVTGGNGGGQVVKQLVKLLSSTAYDRKLETDADMTSVDYLCNANIDPEPFANFLYRLESEVEKGAPKEIYWISTHPESEKRAQEIVKYIKTKKVVKRPLMLTADWEAFKNGVKDL